MAKVFFVKKKTLLRKKKQRKTAYFCIKCCKPCQIKRTNPVNTHRTNTELENLTVRGKIVQTRFLVSESKFFPLKQVFVLTTQNSIDHF